MKNAMVAVLLIAGAGLTAYAQNGVVMELTGTVELKPAGAAAFVTAQTGDNVAANTVVSTGFKSMATLAVGSATIIVRPLTRLTLTEITQARETDTVNVSLQTGRVRVDVKPPAGTKANFTVRSPSATASVRGTGFDLDTRNLYVNNGTVLYQGATGAAIPVTAGSVSRVNAATGAAVIPMDIHTADLLPPPPVSGPPAGPTTAAPAAGRPPELPYDINIDVSWGTE